MKALLPIAALALTGCATVPAAKATPSAALGQTAQVGGLAVRPLRVLEDSRCPMNVRCVWAGRIIVRTEVAGRNWRRTLDLELGKPQPVVRGTIALVSAQPEKMAGTETDARAYLFTYTFHGGL